MSVCLCEYVFVRMSVCVSVCARACVGACMYVHVYVYVRACVRARVRVCDRQTDVRQAVSLTVQVLGAQHQSSNDDEATRASLHRHHHTQHQRSPVQDPQSGYKRNSPVTRADNGKRSTNCAKSVTVSRQMNDTGQPG